MLQPVSEESCDLLEKSYLCGISNNTDIFVVNLRSVVICLKSLTFVVSVTTCNRNKSIGLRCDLLEKSYLCGISNNFFLYSVSLFLL